MWAFRNLQYALLAFCAVSGLTAYDLEANKESNLWALQNVKFSKQITGLSQDLVIDMPYNITSERVNDQICRRVDLLPASKACLAIQRVIADSNCIVDVQQMPDRRVYLVHPPLLRDLRGGGSLRSVATVHQ